MVKELCPDIYLEELMKATARIANPSAQIQAEFVLNPIIYIATGFIF
jgi:hypothetical protein